MQGPAAEKLALFEKLKARGGFAGEDRAELLKLERMLRMFAPMEKSLATGNTADRAQKVDVPITDRCARGLCARGGIEAHGRNALHGPNMRGR